MSIKILNEGFELLHKNSLCEEKSNSSDLEKALENALNRLAMRQEMNIKKYEIAFQDAIESQHPDKSWWEVTDCDIFWDLAENRNPSLTIKHIIDKLKPEFKESLEEGIEDKFFTKAKADAKKLKSLYKKVKDVDKAFKSLGYSYNGDSYEKKVSDGIFIVFSETSSGRFDYNVVNEKERAGTASDVVVLFKEEDESFRNKPLKNRKLKEAVALKESFPTHGNKIDLEKVIQALWEKGDEIGGEDWIEVFNPNEVSKLQSGEEYCNRIEVTGADDKQIKISLKTNGGNIEYQIFNEGRDWKKASSIDELWKVIFDRVGRKTNESLRRKPMRESEKEPEIKRYSDHVPQEKRKYWYFTTHGVQPGSIPKGLHVLEVRDGEDERRTQGTFVMLDGVLNTNELKYYDMRELAPKEETEKRRMRPQGEKITVWESYKKKNPVKESYDEKIVIYKDGQGYKATPESNYRARIQNAKKIQNLKDFDSADEIIDYYVKYGWAKGREDFEVIDECKLNERNLTRSERHNRDMEKIFSTKKAQDKKFADFLRKNGYSEEQVDKLQKQDRLSAEIAKKFTPKGKQPSDILGKILGESSKRKSKKSIKESFAKKHAKKLKESHRRKLTESFDDMEVFMNTWANYNEYGADGVLTPTGWMSIDEAIDYCEEYADYEPFINDTDNVPFDDINEYSNASSALQELKELQESGVDEDVLEAIIEATGYDVKDAIEIAESGDYYFYPGLSSYTDLAYAVIDELGGIGEAVGKNVVNYIDEDQMRREYRWDIREIMRDSAEQEVDDAHEGEDEDSYDREQEIEDWMDEHEDEWIDMIIGEEIEAAERGEADLSSYFDYEAFGRDLSFDGYTITDKGIILVM